MYEFKQEYLTGVPKVDEQHKGLFVLADEAYDLLTDEYMLYKQEDLDRILLGLIAYTKEHFSDEETFMESIEFSELEEQKMQHAKFIDKVEEFAEESRNLSLSNQDKILLELLDYLATWLQRHILESDMKFKQNEW